MKRYRIDENMLIIFINELCDEQLFYSINLFIIDKHSQKLL